jgi:hypothetical protein
MSMADPVLAWGWYGLTLTILFIKSKSTKSAEQTCRDQGLSSLCARPPGRATVTNLPLIECSFYALCCSSLRSAVRAAPSVRHAFAVARDPSSRLSFAGWGAVPPLVPAGVVSEGQSAGWASACSCRFLLVRVGNCMLRPQCSVPPSAKRYNHPALYFKAPLARAPGRTTKDFRATCSATSSLLY